jgi:hypothetical protein
VKHALESNEDSNFVKIVNANEQRVKTISWTNIAAALHRDIEDVNYQWNCYRLSTFRRGPFTPQEDRIIIQRYQEWSLMSEDLKPRVGLWVALEKELNREDKRISERWRSILSKRVASIQQELQRSEVVNSVDPLVPVSVIESEETNKSAGDIDFVLEAARRLPPVTPSTSNNLKPKTASNTRKRNSKHDSSVEELGDTALLMQKSPSVRWNNEMDEILKEACMTHESDWKAIATFVNEHMPHSARLGTVVDDNKCRGRWYRHLRHLPKEDNIIDNFQTPTNFDS